MTTPNPPGQQTSGSDLPPSPVAPAGHPPTGAPPAVELLPEELAAGVALEGDRLLIPAGAFRTMLADRARRELEDRLRPRLQAIKIDSLDDLLQAIEDADKQPPQETSTMTTQANPGAPPAAATPPAAAPEAAPIQTPPAGPPPGVPRAPAAAAQPDVDGRYLPDHTRRRVAQIRNELTSKAQAAEQARLAAEQQAKAHEATISQMRAEETLKLSLASSGVADFEFAWHQLRAHLAELSADKSPEGVERLKKFSADPKAGVKAWADDQRKNRPYLFGAQPVPADTSLPAGTPPAPAPQTPSQVAGAAGAAGEFDARKATGDQIRDRYAAMGVRLPVTRSAFPRG